MEKTKILKFELNFSIILFFHNQQLICFHILKRAFMFLINLNSSLFFEKWIFKKKTTKRFFCKFSLYPGEQIIIRMEFVRAIYCIENEHERIYFFLSVSSWKSHKLTQITVNLWNAFFSEMSDPRVECVAPFSSKEVIRNRHKNNRRK